MTLVTCSQQAHILDLIMKIRNKKLAGFITTMANEDQRLRRGAKKDPSVWQAVKQMDKKHFSKIKRLIEQFGWPTKSLVGKRASHMAWLLVQHTDSDVKFQEECLVLLIEAEKKGEVDKTEIAFLTDRILINQGKPQRYGTQFHTDESGNIRAKPIEPPLRLFNKRRQDMGLGSFADYRKQIERGWSSNFAKRD